MQSPALQEGVATVWLLFLFLLTGPVIIGIGVREAVHQRRLRREGVSAEGVVLRHRSERQQGSTVFFAVVNFVDAQGSSHQFEVNESGVEGLPVGGRATVRYLPGAPKTARIHRPSKRGGVVPLLVGVAFTATGIWGLCTGR